MNIHATAFSMLASKSLASLRQRPSQAKTRSTTQRRESSSSPLVTSDLLMISMVLRDN